MHIPRKRFGQHFLTDSSVIDAIVRAIGPQPRDNMVEIGPGLGALTEPLLAQLPHLHVVELDRDIVARLKRIHTPQELSIHEGDALRFDFGTLGADLRVVGNLPYNISSPLLFHLAEFPVRDLHFMLQKEVVDRIVAEPSTPDYGRLSVMLQYRFHTEWLFDVPPEAFNPPPKVDSAVVRLVPKQERALNAEQERALSEVVAAAFSQRRKTVRNTLSRWFDAAALTGLGVDPGARAEALPLDIFLNLARAAAVSGR